MKSCVVIGLGRFGREAARRLCELGCEVLAVDNRSELVQQISLVDEELLKKLTET